jgi:N-methylhydantoinase A
VPARVQRGELMGMWTALARVDVESVGSGGGSIGWIDARGMLRVGPRSAGSSPGPACYGRGGTAATVTDALLVLGYLDPDRFLGGTMTLDRDAADAACAALGAPIGLDATETAWGMRALALAEMATAVRTRIAQRGLDAGAHPLVSYGGCASLFIPEIALVTGAPAVLVPEFASVLSAYGAATTPIRRDRLRTVLRTFPLDAAELRDALAALADAVAADLLADGVATGDQAIAFEADLRFTGQRSEVTVRIDDHTDPDRLVARFRTEYVGR